MQSNYDCTLCIMKNMMNVLLCLKINRLKRNYSERKYGMFIHVIIPENIPEEHYNDDL